MKAKTHNGLQKFSYQGLRLSKEKIQEIGDKMYKKAMKHMNKFNKYEVEKEKRKKQIPEEVPPQCTFRPQIFTKKYKNRYSNISTHQKGMNASNRLIQWGQRRDRKIIEKAVNRSLQEKEKNYTLRLNRSAENIIIKRPIIKNLSNTSFNSRNVKYGEKFSYVKSQASLEMKTDHSSANL